MNMFATLTFFPHFPSAVLGLAQGTARFVQHRTSLIHSHHRTEELGDPRSGEPAGTGGGPMRSTEEL